MVYKNFDAGISTLVSGVLFVGFLMRNFGGLIKAYKKYFEFKKTENETKLMLEGRLSIAGLVAFIIVISIAQQYFIK